MRIWEVFFEDEFDVEFEALPLTVQNDFYTQAQWIERFGPELGRPRVDTLKGSEFANMKELRFRSTGGVWRFAFAFDPKRRAIVLVAGDKSGVGQARFYQQLISKADARYLRHLNSLENAGREPKGRTDEKP